MHSPFQFTGYHSNEPVLLSAYPKPSRGSIYQTITQYFIFKNPCTYSGALVYVFWKWWNKWRKASWLSPPHLCSSPLLRVLLLTLPFLHSPDKTHPPSVGRPFPIRRSHSHFSTSGTCSVPGSQGWRFSSAWDGHGPCPHEVFLFIIMQIIKLDNVRQQYIGKEEWVMILPVRMLEIEWSGKSVSAQLPYLFNENNIHEVAPMEKPCHSS